MSDGGWQVGQGGHGWILRIYDQMGDGVWQMVEWMAEAVAANVQSSERSREGVKRLIKESANLQIFQRRRKLVELKLKVQLQHEVQ